MIDLVVLGTNMKHFLPAIDEYTKRLGSFVKISYVRTKNFTNITIQQQISTETQVLSEFLKKNKKKDVYVCNPMGEQFTTEELYTKISLHSFDGIICIGGPYGLDYSLLTDEMYKSRKRLKHVSLGKMTYPHGLVVVLILEQLYRLTTLHSGKSYHY